MCLREKKEVEFHLKGREGEGRAYLYLAIKAKYWLISGGGDSSLILRVEMMPHI